MWFFGTPEEHFTGQLENRKKHPATHPRPHRWKLMMHLETKQGKEGEREEAGRGEAQTLTSLLFLTLLEYDVWCKLALLRQCLRGCGQFLSVGHVRCLFLSVDAARDPEASGGLSDHGCIDAVTRRQTASVGFFFCFGLFWFFLL